MERPKPTPDKQSIAMISRQAIPPELLEKHSIEELGSIRDTKQKLKADKSNPELIKLRAAQKELVIQQQITAIKAKIASGELIPERVKLLEENLKTLEAKLPRNS